MSRNRRRRREQRREMVPPEREEKSDGAINADEEPVSEAEERGDELTAEEGSEDAEFERGMEEGEEAEEGPAPPMPLTDPNDDPRVAGIRIFTAMLEEVRGGYIADRLSQIEQILGESFNAQEREGISEIAAMELGEDGVPDVEYAVRLALDARRKVADAVEGVAEEIEDEPQAEAEEERDEIPPSPAEKQPDTPADDDIREGETPTEAAARRALEAEERESDRPGADE